MVKYTSVISEVCAALSDQTRHDILERLASRGESSMLEIAQPYAMSLPAVSKHLRVLETASLVSVRRNGRHRLYSLNPRALAAFRKWFESSHLFWIDAIERMARHVETEHTRHIRRRGKKK